MHDDHHHHCRKKTLWSRRDFLFQSGGGIAGLALADMLDRQGLLAAEAGAVGHLRGADRGQPVRTETGALRARAKAVISLFMSGGVSQVDTFDPKPALKQYAGQPMAESVVVRQGHPGPLMPSPFEFHRRGDSGIEVSEIFPHIGSKVDEMAFIRSMYGRSRRPHPGDLRDAERADPDGLPERGGRGSPTASAPRRRACPPTS